MIPTIQRSRYANSDGPTFFVLSVCTETPPILRFYMLWGGGGELSAQCLRHVGSLTVTRHKVMEKVLRTVRPKMALNVNPECDLPKLVFSNEYVMFIREFGTFSLNRVTRLM